MSTEDGSDAPGRWAVVRELVAVCLDVTASGVFDDAAIAIGAPDQAGLVLACSSPRARAMLEWETVCGEGPAWLVWQARGAAAVRDTGDPVVMRSWPAYVAGASEQGVRGAAAVPLAVGGAALGVLAAFSSAPIEVDADDLSRLGAAAARATTVVLDACSSSEADPASSAGALVNARLHQAAGMVAARYELVVDDALALLRARAFAGNVSLDVVATDVVAGRDVVVRR